MTQELTMQEARNPVTNRYCVIGAGYCGLGVAKGLRDYGIPFDVIERNADVGGNWLNGVYDSTHIISSRKTTEYADFPMPADYPDFPSAAQILSYLRAYADRFSLREHIRFDTEVERIEPIDPTGMSGWRVRLKGGETREYAGVIVANGHHWDKRIPRYPGEFSGKTIHSKDYKRPSDLEGKSVLVVGAGNSGCDIAVEAALNGLESHISMRRGYYFLPKTVFGMPVAELDRPWLPFRAQRAIGKLAIRLSAGSNSRYGLEEPDHDLFDHHPIVNSQLLYFIRHGKVKPRKDIERFEGRTVRFVDGSSLEVDTIVWATGFHVSFPFMDRGIFEWENGIPKRVAGMLPAKVANLYVFGLSQPRGGAGPLITEGAKVLAEMLLTQQSIDVPLAEILARVSPPSARMLVGVSQAMREMRAGRKYLRLVRARRGKAPLATASEEPRQRNLKFDFGGSFPRHWMGGDLLGSHIVNSLNLLFPEGERFFVRSVNHFLPRVKDPELRKRAKVFIAQEVQHGREHERYFQTLRDQGFRIDGFLRFYEKFGYGVLEPLFGRRLNLATTAALEHFTASFAEDALASILKEERIEPVMEDLLRWHAIEEIEHKAVAFDVLQAVAPGYFTRVAGLLIGLWSLGMFWLIGTLMLLRQDPEAGVRRILREQWSGAASRMIRRRPLSRAILSYLAPGFHPSGVANYGLARDAIRELQSRYPAANIA